MKMYKKHKLFIPICLIWVIWITPCTAQLDATFGNGGIVIIPLGNGTGALTTIKLHNDTIILAGNYDNSGVEDIGVVKLTKTGVLESSFGTNGKASVAITPTTNYIYSMDLQSDGKMVFGGGISYNAGYSSIFSSVNLNVNGSLNTGFNIDGLDTCVFSGGPSVVYATKVISGDKILLLGVAGSTDGSDYALAKLNTDGTYDLTFNSTGKFTYSIDAGDEGHCLGIQSSGKIIIGGYCTTGFTAIRVNTNGTIDNTFGTSGHKIITIGAQDEAYSMAIQADDKIVLAGRSGSVIAVVRLNADGSPDLTFGTNGITTITQGTTTIGHSVAIDHNNKIVVTGYTFNGTGSDVFVVRLTINGSEDIRSIIQVGIGNSVGRSVLIDANNKIVIGCSAIATDSIYDNFAVIRLDDMFVTGVIAGIDISTNLNIFPNPTTQNITINSTYHIEQIKVVDVIGNEVMNIPSSGNTQVDVSTLPKGLYNFVITTDKGVGSKKVSVQ